MIKETLYISEKVCVALGYFDSVHKGHLAIINVLKSLADEQKSKAAISTFINNPSAILGDFKPNVFTYDERLEVFNEMNLDYVLPFSFSDEFKNVSAAQFVSLIFKSNITGIVCGYDYKYGKKGEGNIESLKQECDARGVPIRVVQPVNLFEKRVSTTEIVKLIASGDMVNANLALSRQFFIKGRVVHGFKRGREMGTPTINLEFSCGKVLPAAGVYATNTIISGRKYKSVTNVGVKPTFSDKSFTIESFLKDFNNSVYDEVIKTEFVKKLRETRKFSCMEDLSEQIKSDLSWE